MSRQVNEDLPPGWFEAITGAIGVLDAFSDVSREAKRSAAELRALVDEKPGIAWPLAFDEVLATKQTSRGTEAIGLARGGLVLQLSGKAYYKLPDALTGAKDKLVSQFKDNDRSWFSDEFMRSPDL